MVSTRPGPSPAKGRIAYPRADAYVPGDEDTSPAVAGVEPTSESAAQSFAAHIRASSPDNAGTSSGVRRKGSLRSNSPDKGPKSVGGLMKGLGLPLTGSAVHAAPIASVGSGSYGLGTVHDDPRFGGGVGQAGTSVVHGVAGPGQGRTRSPSSPPAMQQSFPRQSSAGNGGTGTDGIGAGALSINTGAGAGDRPINTVLLGHSSIPEESPTSAGLTAASASAPGQGASLGKVKSIQIPVSALFANELGRQDSRGSDKDRVRGKSGLGKGLGSAGPGTAGGYTSESDKSPDKERSNQAQGLKSWWKGFIERERAGSPGPGAMSGAEDDKDKDRKGKGLGEGRNRPRGASASAALSQPTSGQAGGTVAAATAGAGQGGGGKKVFGVPLAQSIEYASVQVSTVGEDGSFVIPVVVARCGLYLKETATEVEGAFRISGSAKRMRDLQEVFDTPPRYGKDIKWDDQSYTPHDVATIFRRFLTLAPESIIPTSLYEDFRAVLAEKSTPPTESETASALAQYKTLILSMPAVNQYLLLYVLDLLSVFARKSEINLMTTANLAMIFQPGVLAHPVHAMRPREHVLSQRVLEFLIENQDEFLVGMELEKPKKRKSKRRAKADKEKERAKALAQKAAQLTKADPDLMPPSESDDDAPSGGYYIIEGNPKLQASDNRQGQGQGQGQGSEGAGAGTGEGQGRPPSIRVPTQTVYDATTGKIAGAGSTTSLARTTSRASAAVSLSRVQSPGSASATTKSPQSAQGGMDVPPPITAIQLAPPPPKPRNRAGSAGAGTASSSGIGGTAAPTPITGTVSQSQASVQGHSQSQTHAQGQAHAHAHTARSPPPTTSSHLPAPTAIQEEMEPSDSDEDMPNGTRYEVHVSDAAKAREAKANVKAGHGAGQEGGGRRMSLGGAGEGKGGILGLGLGRRRTVRGDGK